MDGREFDGDVDLRAYLSRAAHDQWMSINISDWRPLGRYKHSAQVVGEKLYVVSGSRNGRYLSDIQVFNFRTLKWSPLNPNYSLQDNADPKEVFPAFAGHSLVKWENKLLVVAGHSKEASDIVTVFSIDLETNKFSVVNTNGIAPIARGGQSVTLVGTRLLIFGGEDRRRRLLNDLHILDLSTMSWDSAKTKNTSPAPRLDHTATVHADRYLLIFGGSSHSTCFNDLHVLDLQTMEWSQPETQGATVAPRGGHAGATVDENWYIAGGGDNKRGAIETVVLNMSKLVWSLSTSVKERDPLASEGLTVCSATLDREKFLVAFGGYNGKYNNELFVLKPKARDSIQPKLFQSLAAAAAAASVSAAYALTNTTEKNNDIARSESASLKLTQAKSLPNSAAIDTDKLSSERDILKSKLQEETNEKSKFKDRLDEMNNSRNLLQMELQSVEGQLTAERSRCSKLEMQIAEIQTRLETFSSVEHELETLRRQKLQIEHNMTASHRQSSGGIWGWMAGTAPNQVQ